MLRQELDGCPQIDPIGGEVRLGKIPLAVSQATEVESKHSPSMFCQSSADPYDCLEVFIASEAMGEQKKTTGLVDRLVEYSGESSMLAPLELDSNASSQLVQWSNLPSVAYMAFCIRPCRKASAMALGISDSASTN